MRHLVLLSSLQNFIQIILNHCYLEKKSNPGHTSSASKKNCLKLPKSLALKFNKGKQSKLEFNPCVKPLFFSSKVSQSTSSTVSLISDCVKLNTSTLLTYLSSTVTSASLRSFNSFSRNTASNLDCNIQNDSDSFLEKVSTKMM